MVETNDFASAISRTFGWIYVLAWSLSFYPQPLLNYRRQSTLGLTVDFPLLNVLGFACYTVSTTSFLFIGYIRQQYAARHPLAPEPTVRLNDFVFALHALIVVLVTYSQLYSRLWGFADIKGKRASTVTYGIFWGSLISIIIIVLIVVVRNEPGSDAGSWAAIDAVYAISYVKLLVTCAKYVPQAWHNYLAKSTSGWSIGQVLLDLIGGILSIAQLIIDSASQADWSGVTGNPVKLLLGNVSILFDIIFIVQHYILYRDKTSKEVDVEDQYAEEEALLGDSR